MRAVYLFIVLFLAWCVICTRWYIFSVKGLPADPVHFNPHETTMAIVEIVFMVLVAFLLGFVIAWLLRESGMKQKQSALHSLHTERVSLLNSQTDLKNQLKRQESKLEEEHDTVVVTSRENERLKAELEERHEDGQQWQKELDALRPKMKEAESELNLLRFRVRQSEHQTTEHEELRKKLQEQLDECKEQRRYEREEPVFSDFISGQHLGGISMAGEDEKDNLREISGIGPGIQKKLYGMGIFTFKQISEFTEETTRQVAEAIEFFPGRIERDRWVEQASRLYLEKIRK